MPERTQMNSSDENGNETDRDETMNYGLPGTTEKVTRGDGRTEVVGGVDCGAVACAVMRH